VHEHRFAHTAQRGLVPHPVGQAHLERLFHPENYSRSVFPFECERDA
jgi:hypothetical protein